MSEKELVQSNTATEHHSESQAASRPKSRLPLDVLETIGKIERQTRGILQKCLDENIFLAGFMLDLEKVTEIMLASAAESSRARVEYYEGQQGFCRDWLDEIIDETTGATLELAPPGFLLLPGSRYRGAVPAIREQLKRELRAILKIRAEAPKAKVKEVFDEPEKSIAQSTTPKDIDKQAGRRSVLKPVSKPDVGPDNQARNPMSPRICLEGWGEIPSDHPDARLAPSWGGDTKFLQWGFNLINDGGAAYNVRVESFAIEPSVNARSKPIPRIAEKGTQFALVWLDGYSEFLRDVSKLDLAAAMDKVGQAKYGNLMYSPDFSVSVSVICADGDGREYRTRQQLTWIKSHGRLVFGPPTFERLAQSVSATEDTQTPVEKDPIDPAGAVPGPGEKERNEQAGALTVSEMSARSEPAQIIGSYPHVFGERKNLPAEPNLESAEDTRTPSSAPGANTDSKETPTKTAELVKRVRALAKSLELMECSAETRQTRNCQTKTAIPEAMAAANPSEQAKRTKRPGRPRKEQTTRIQAEWNKIGRPQVTAAVCDKIGKQFFAEELRGNQPGSVEQKRVRERVRKAILRSSGNEQHN